MFIGSFLYATATRKLLPILMEYISDQQISVFQDYGWEATIRIESRGRILAQPFTPIGTFAGGDLVIGLQDIGLGGSTGGSPWDYSQRQDYSQTQIQV
ncbi:hypothetical protein N7520_001006 [Penicillium odoratum]|uniref:uncharacterized protein n=1 Tax=Penicillium odoratum TaxID=1167516 RepID=UPI00254932D8|nr:uncharacterized protein N7520_001006 [Penicillium odoratum]KAJ5777760.1 hypothetical protein N7520_001006 [Penicillium odoratum]